MGRDDTACFLSISRHISGRLRRCGNAHSGHDVPYGLCFGTEKVCPHILLAQRYISMSVAIVSKTLFDLLGKVTIIERTLYSQVDVDDVL